jgi:hypothetical protein
MQQVKALRDPLAHPAEGDVNYDDAFVLTDAARRTLEGKVKARGQFVSSYSTQDRSPLLSRVPGASFGEGEECFVVNPKLASDFSRMLARMEAEEAGTTSTE